MRINVIVLADWNVRLEEMENLKIFQLEEDAKVLMARVPACVRLQIRFPLRQNMVGFCEISFIFLNINQFFISPIDEI
jgi:hypothetical protein